MMSTAPCIRCGNCLAACPVQISPVRLFALWQDSAVERMSQEESLEACLLCRRCDKVCPSELPLAASFAQARQQAQAARHRQQNAERLRLRHENHLRRLATPRRYSNLKPAALAARARQNVKNQYNHQS